MITEKRYLTSNMEGCVEAIYNLSKEKRSVRIRGIAQRLGVKMSSVISMLKSLKEKVMINYEKYEYLELREKGLDIGREIACDTKSSKHFWLIS